MSVAAARRRALEFAVLGPLEVLDGGCSVPLGGGKLRVLLAAMLIRPREVRSADALIHDLWGERAPATARSSLHNLVSALRRTLGGMIETSSSGYALAVSDDQIDARRFERLVRISRDQTSTDKVGTIELALSLWRGSPLVDVRYACFAQTEIRRLEELQVTALDYLISAQIDLGLSDVVVPELQVLVDRFPFRERLRMQLMVALHRCGRSIEALATYTAWRDLLAESWEIEPGHEIELLRSEITTGTVESTRVPELLAG